MAHVNIFTLEKSKDKDYISAGPVHIKQCL